MSVTRPTGEQLLFNSSKTGEWVLDDYLEATERGSRTLGALIADLFDTGGALRQNINQFRLSSTRELETRFGTFVSPSLGWVGTGAYFPRYRGTWTSGVDYKESDYAERLGVVYLCTSDHTSTGVFDTSKFVTLINSPAVGALSNVTPAADTLAYYTSGTTAASTPITPFARSLLDDANSAAMRATLGFDADYVSKSLGTFQTMTSGLRSLGVLESTSISGLLATYGGQQAQLTSEALRFNGGARYSAVSATQSARISFGGYGPGVGQFSTPLGTVTVVKTAGGGAGSISTSVQSGAGATFGATVTLTFTAPAIFNVTGAGTGNPTGLSYSSGMSLSFNGWTAILTGAFTTGDTYTFNGVPADVQRFGVTEAGLAAIGDSFSAASLFISNTLAGLGAQAQGVSAAPRIGTGTGTTTFSGFLSDPVLAAGFTGNIASLRHFSASAGSMSLGGGQTLAQEAGFYVGNLPLATQRFGLYADLVASAAAAWNVYAAGSAPNFFSGQVGIGDLPTNFPDKFVVKITGAGNTAVAAYDSEATGVSTYRVGGAARGEIHWNNSTFTIGGTGASALALTAGGATRLSIDTSGAVTIPGSLTLGANAAGALQAVPLQQLETTHGLVNRAINGAFEVDEWNIGVRILVGNRSYIVDRWFGQSFPSNALSAGQATLAAPGYRVSLSANTYVPTNPPPAHLYNAFRQFIEGSIIRDCKFGSSGARSLAVSFIVSSSLTGPHAISFTNLSETRSYVATYTVNVAGAWEYKTILIPGDTGGSWDLDYLVNEDALGVCFDFGSGSDRETSTLNTWVDGYFTRRSDCVRHIQTSGAFLRIDGFQLLVNNSALPFIPRLASEELWLCRRYMQRLQYPPLRGVVAAGGQPARMGMVLPVHMRGVPTVLFLGSLSVYDGSNTGTINSASIQYNRQTSIELDCPLATGGPLTLGRACVAYVATGSIIVNAEY
jgi:hypothetical protein